MKIKHYIALAALTMPLATSAQSTVIDFETTETQGTSLGVFDTWEDSPFRKGKLEGNIKVINNPYKVVDDITNDGNISEKVLAFQRSRFGSNTFGVRVGLPTPIKLTPKVQYVHVKMYTPKTGHIMLFALGSRDDRPEQSKDVVQVEANCISSVKAENGAMQYSPLVLHLVCLFTAFSLLLTYSQHTTLTKTTLFILMTLKSIVLQCLTFNMAYTP